MTKPAAKDAVAGGASGPTQERAETRHAPTRRETPASHPHASAASDGGGRDRTATVARASPAGRAASAPLYPARAVASALQLPLSVLSFLEAQVPEVRAVATGSTLSYRAEDAALLAGVAELLYQRGVTLREAKWALRSGEREAIRAIGLKRLGLDTAAPLGAGAPSRPIPRDALVGRRGVAGQTPSTLRRAPSPEAAAVLAELMACVRLLHEAR